MPYIYVLSVSTLVLRIHLTLQQLASSSGTQIALSRAAGWKKGTGSDESTFVWFKFSAARASAEVSTLLSLKDWSALLDCPLFTICYCLLLTICYCPLLTNYSLSAIVHYSLSAIVCY